MTGRFKLSPRAQGDVDDIWDRTAERWDVNQAEIYTRQLGQRVALVAANPSLGRACPEIRAGYYRFPSGAHLLFHRITNAGIEIVRILHERMDYARSL